MSQKPQKYNDVMTVKQVTKQFSREGQVQEQAATDILALVQRREEAIVTFLTGHSITGKLQAVFNAAGIDRQLHNTAFMRRQFQAVSGGQPPQDSLLGKLYVRSQNMTQWQAAMQLFRKAQAYGAWEKAHDNNEFAEYAKLLDKVISAQIDIESKSALSLGMASAYESRLDRFTPGLRENDVLRWFEALTKQAKIFKRAAVLRGRLDDNSRQEVQHRLQVTPAQEQRIILRIMKDFGIDEHNADIHFASHPMCFDHGGRAQILLRSEHDHIIDAVMDAVHEAGHALYRIHMGDEVRESLLGLIETDYAGADECMAMLFDHHIAQTPEFAQYLTRVLKQELSDEAASYINEADMIGMLLARPHGLNRVSAGPEQYALFMVQYGRLEHGLMSGKITFAELADRWDKLSAVLHERSPEIHNLSETVYQDPHWALGELGRFSGGYLPGMLMAAQCYEMLDSEAPHAIDAIRHGDFSNVIAWAKNKLYSQKRHENYNAFMRHATKRGLDEEAFMRQARLTTARLERLIKAGKADCHKPPQP